jgi:hypothetical protein
MSTQFENLQQEIAIDKAQTRKEIIIPPQAYDRTQLKHPIIRPVLHISVPSLTEKYQQGLGISQTAQTQTTSLETQQTAPMPGLAETAVINGNDEKTGTNEKIGFNPQLIYETEENVPDKYITNGELYKNRDSNGQTDEFVIYRNSPTETENTPFYQNLLKKAEEIAFLYRDAEVEQALMLTRLVAIEDIDTSISRNQPPKKLGLSDENLRRRRARLLHMLLQDLRPAQKKLAAIQEKKGKIRSSEQSPASQSGWIEYTTNDGHQLRLDPSNLPQNAYMIDEKTGLPIHSDWITDKMFEIARMSPEKQITDKIKPATQRHLLHAKWRKELGESLE